MFLVVIDVILLQVCLHPMGNLRVCILVFVSSNYPLCRKVDDLQFLLEEQGIISGDTLEMATETSAQKLRNLQQQLDNEKENSRRLQQQLEVCVFPHSNSVT